MKTPRINIFNRKSHFHYEVISTLTAGIVLVGSEVKSIILNGASISEAYCYISNSEVFIKGMTVPIYEFANTNNHIPNRERKLLLNRQEINKIEKELKVRGITLIPLRLFQNEKGKIKLEIGVCRGKKDYQKKQSLKEKDLDRETKRELNNE